jgi:hypothetical protein
LRGHWDPRCRCHRHILDEAAAEWLALSEVGGEQAGELETPRYSRHGGVPMTLLGVVVGYVSGRCFAASGVVFCGARRVDIDLHDMAVPPC